jgi:hypothetical protein
MWSRTISDDTQQAISTAAAEQDEDTEGKELPRFDQGDTGLFIKGL